MKSYLMTRETQYSFSTLASLLAGKREMRGKVAEDILNHLNNWCEGTKIPFEVALDSNHCFNAIQVVLLKLINSYSYYKIRFNCAFRVICSS